MQFWYFATKIFLTYCEKNCSSDQEKRLSFEAEGLELQKFLTSLEQFIRIVQFLKQTAFLTYSSDPIH